MKRYHIYVHFFFRITTPTDRKKTKRTCVYDDSYDPHPHALTQPGAGLKYRVHSMCYDRNDISISERLGITVLRCGTASVERIQGELSSIKVEHVVICKSLSIVNVHLPSCASRTDNFRDCFVAANVKSNQFPVHGDRDVKCSRVLRLHLLIPWL